MRNFVATLALALASGVGAEENSVRDLNIQALLELAGGGDSSAQHALCYRFLYGEGVEKNYANAIHWCEIAAKSGAASSLTLLAEIYYLGHVSTPDFSRAFSLYKQAAEKGQAHAQYMLSKMYFLGQGTEQDQVAGLEWLQRAADQKYGPAMKALQQLNAEPRTEA